MRVAEQHLVAKGRVG